MAPRAAGTLPSSRCEDALAGTACVQLLRICTMTPIRFTLRHNAATFDWELVEDSGARASMHYLTRHAACIDVARDAQVMRQGATVRIHGADGGYEAERRFAA